MGLMTIRCRWWSILISLASHQTSKVWPNRERLSGTIRGSVRSRCAAWKRIGGRPWRESANQCKSCKSQRPRRLTLMCKMKDHQRDRRLTRRRRTTLRRTCARSWTQLDSQLTRRMKLWMRMILPIWWTESMVYVRSLWLERMKESKRQKCWK